MISLKDHCVVVTGGGRGIGRGIAMAMAEAGATVIVAGRTVIDLDQVREEIAGATGAQVVAVPTDVTDPAQIDHLVVVASQQDAPLSGWVNNAGAARLTDVGPLMDLSESQWDAVVDLNLKCAFFASQAAARAMASTGGSIVNISSRSGSLPNPRTGQYGAAKAGLENLTSTMAVEWGSLGIRVNAVAPGLIVVERSVWTQTPDRQRRQEEVIPLRRLGAPADIGPTCAFLVSPLSSYITGSTIAIDGGCRIAEGYLPFMHYVTSRGQTGHAV